MTGLIQDLRYALRQLPDLFSPSASPRSVPWWPWDTS